MSAPEPQPHLYRALDRAKELEAEVDRLREALNASGAHSRTHAAKRKKKQKQLDYARAELQGLRAAIEKLRDDTREGEVPVLGGLATQIWFARRLTEMLNEVQRGGDSVASADSPILEGES